MSNGGRFRIHSCCSCRKQITWQFAICANCEKIYGNRAVNWPDWLRFKWNDIQRERRRHYKIARNEITESDFEVLFKDE